MDCCMTFNVHIDELHKKLFGTLLFLNRITKRFYQDCRKMVIQSLILSSLNYALKVWGSTNKSNIQKAQKLQNFASKVAVGGAKRSDHATPLIEKLNWLRIDKQYIFELCLFVFKIKTNRVPEWLFEFPSAGEMRDANVVTRQNNNLFIPRTRTNTGARNLHVEGPRLWNSLPNDLLDCQSLSCFKKKLFDYLFYR